MKLAVIKDNGMTQYVVDLALEAGFRPEDISIAQDESSAMTLGARHTRYRHRRSAPHPQ